MIPVLIPLVEYRAIYRALEEKAEALSMEEGNTSYDVKTGQVVASGWWHFSRAQIPGSHPRIIYPSHRWNDDPRWRGRWFVPKDESLVMHFSRKPCEKLTMRDTVICLARIHVFGRIRHYLTTHMVGRCPHKTEIEL